MKRRNFLTHLAGGAALGAVTGPTRSEGVEEFVHKVSGGQKFESFEQEFFERVRPTSLLKRFETVDEIASVVAFVCSPLAAGMNGSSIRVEGGLIKAIA